MTEGGNRPSRSDNKLTRLTRTLEAAAGRLPLELVLALVLVGLQILVAGLGLFLSLEESGPHLTPLTAASGGMILWLLVLFAGLWSRAPWAWWAGMTTFWLLTVACLGGALLSVAELIGGDLEQDLPGNAFTASVLFVSGFGLFGVPAGLLLSCRRRFFRPGR